MIRSPVFQGTWRSHIVLPIQNIFVCVDLYTEGLDNNEPVNFVSFYAYFEYFYTDFLIVNPPELDLD